MALESLTLEELKEKRPDLVAAISKEIESQKENELDDLSGPWNPNPRHADSSEMLPDGVWFTQLEMSTKAGDAESR